MGKRVDLSCTASLTDATGASDPYSTQKVRFETGSDIDATTVKVAVDYYSTES